MEEIEYEVTRNSSVDGDELDRYAVYRLLLLSFEKDVRSGDMEFDELLMVEKVAADICGPFIRLSAIRLLKSHNVEIYFEKENIWTFDSKGELLITIMSSMAQEESRSISENVRWGC